MRTICVLLKLLVLVVFFISSSNCFGQSPIGIWATIDDETQQVKSHIQIYEKDGKIYGSILKLLVKPENENCIKCTGNKANKPLIGLMILEGLKKSDKEWTHGNITDPKNGKTYRCTISMESNDKLKVRGYIGFSLLGRTQYWTRVK